ncbi:MAG: HU family DNA-binding protein [Alphaproteobacteria bacterium]|nr:HU family DNA-binding protein [Alphaproteobacteria bacterium]
MNKQALADVVQNITQGTKSQAVQVVDTLFDSIVNELKKGGEVSVSGFGVFVAKKRDARMGRNPATGATVQIAASVSPKFRAAKAFKDALKS